MITSYMIMRTNIFESYKLDIELNMHVRKFLKGLKI
jgi:hypothetical protein